MAKTNFQIPVVRVNGKYGLYFAGYAQHYSIYPVTAGMLAGMRDELAPHLSGKATLRFSASKPVPVDLIRRIAACRAAELEGGAKAPDAPRKSVRKG